jgi:hypothetical protein
MVSSCELRFDDLSITSQKAWVPDEFIYLFQENDRWGVYPENEDEEDEEPEVGYFATRAVILHRLEIAGYTAEHARGSFELWLEKQRKSLARFVIDGVDPADQITAQLERFNYEEWQRRLRDVLTTRYDSSRPMDVYVDEIDRMMRSLNQDWLFFSGDVLTSIRAMLEALPEVQEISLDIGPLIGGGWIEPDAKICEERRAPDAQWRSILQPTVIIAEGSTDIAVLKRSLQRLHPHLADYITFFDYEGSNPDGGASYIVKFLRAFAAARINTPILAMFDNDAAGLEALGAASRLALPDHIQVTKLPDIELARCYPTLGPQGEHVVDINGRAVSIELFLGRQNLAKQDGSLTPIVWGNYVPKVQSYQGAIQDKSDIFSRFLRETQMHDASENYSLRFPELAQLWEHILSLLKPKRGAACEFEY